MAERDPDLSRDAFLGGRMTLLQPRRGYRAATDPVLLAASVPARTGESVLDLGCGAGAVLFCLEARVGGLGLAGLELQPRYADLARRNAAENGATLEVFEGDLGDMPAALRTRSFDHVVANPPFHAAGEGTAASDDGRERAFREATPLAVWIDAACRRLRPGGTLSLVQRTARLADLFAALDSRLGSIEIKPLSPRRGREAARVILRARKGGKGVLRLHAPLILHAGDAHTGDRESYGPEAHAILREAAPLVF